MTCDEAAPQIPLAALDALDAADAAGLARHVDDCARCAARLRELRATRGALAAATVAAAAPLDVDAVMAAAADAGEPAAPRLVAPWRRSLRRVAAAAAWLGVAALAGWLGGRQTRDGAARSSEVVGPTAETLARGLLLLDDRLTELETRHPRDLLLLAQSIDRAQQSRDRGYAEQLATLAWRTGRQLEDARTAVFTIAQQLPAATLEDAPTREQ